MEKKRWSRPGEFLGSAPPGDGISTTVAAPATARASASTPMQGDRDMIPANTRVNTRIDGAGRLWESRFAYNLSAHWCAGTLAASGLKSLALRPKDSPSADAAGLPTTPLPVKEAEASAGPPSAG
jgi:hypothetical protein